MKPELFSQACKEVQAQAEKFRAIGASADVSLMEAVRLYQFVHAMPDFKPEHGSGCMVQGQHQYGHVGGDR